MPRRVAIRLVDLKTVLQALKEAGQEPVAFDVLPDGTHRWHFTKPVLSDEDDLDHELEEFNKKNGYG